MTSTARMTSSNTLNKNLRKICVYIYSNYGGTSFRAAVSELVKVMSSFKEKPEVAVVFMTDGQDGDSRSTLQGELSTYVCCVERYEVITTTCNKTYNNTYNNTYYNTYNNTYNNN